MWEQLLSAENLGRALRHVRANGGAPGVDGMTTEELVPWLREYWAQVRQALRAGLSFLMSCPADGCEGRGLLTWASQCSSGRPDRMLSRLTLRIRFIGDPRRNVSADGVTSW